MTIKRILTLLNMVPKEKQNGELNIVLVKDDKKEFLLINNASITSSGEDEDDLEVTIYVERRPGQYYY